MQQCLLPLCHLSVLFYEVFDVGSELGLNSLCNFDFETEFVAGNSVLLIWKFHLCIKKFI
jgi:hypothetical protein